MRWAAGRLGIDMTLERRVDRKAEARSAHSGPSEACRRDSSQMGTGELDGKQVQKL